MKKLAVILLLIAMIFACSACQGSEPAKPADTAAETPDIVQPAGPEQPEKPETPEIPETPETPDKTEEPAPEDNTEDSGEAADAPLQLSSQTNRYYGMYEEGMKCYVDYPRIRADGAAGTGLADALDSLNAALYQKAYETGERLKTLPLRESLYSGQIVQYITRADGAALSLLYETVVDDGKDEPEWSFEAYNFDPETGAVLTLNEVFSDANMLPDMLETRLRETYPNVAFKDLWPVLTSAGVFEEAEAEQEEQFAWTLSYEGIQFYFQPGLIADYEDGSFQVTVRYDDQPAAIAQKYQRIPKQYAEMLEHQSSRRIDLDGDGRFENLLLEVPAKMEENGWTVRAIDLTVDGKKTSIACPENTVQVQAYLLHVPSGTFLYAVCTDAAGMDSLLVISLKAKTTELLETVERTGLPVTEQDGAYWRTLLTDPADFALQTAAEAGGPDVTAQYYVGETGLPVSKS